MFTSSSKILPSIIFLIFEYLRLPMYMRASFIILFYFMPSQCMNHAYFNDVIFYNRLCSFLNLKLSNDSNLRV